MEHIANEGNNLHSEMLCWVTKKVLDKQQRGKS